MYSNINLIKIYRTAALVSAAKPGNNDLHHFNGIAEGNRLLACAQPFDKQIKLLFESVIGILAVKVL